MWGQLAACRRGSLSIPLALHMLLPLPLPRQLDNWCWRLHVHAGTSRMTAMQCQGQVPLDLRTQC